MVYGAEEFVLVEGAFHDLIPLQIEAMRRGNCRVATRSSTPGIKYGRHMGGVGRASARAICSFHVFGIRIGCISAGNHRTNASN